MPALRLFDGSKTIAITKSQQSLSFTVNPINVELWLLLGSIVEVREKGLTLFKRKRNLSKVALSHTYDRFRAFCYQARNYYDSASHLPWDSSPLLYYYSFMNLAKAIILLHKDLPDKAIHGLHFPTEYVAGSIRSHNIHLISDYNKGIFPILYETIFQHQPSVANFNAFKLFRYISQVYKQTASVGLNKFNHLLGYAKLVVNRNPSPGSGWLVILGPMDTDLTQKWPFSAKFRNFFEVVDKNHNTMGALSTVFGMKVSELSRFKIYQSVNTRALNVARDSDFCNDLFSAAPNVITERVFPVPSDFVYNLPYQQDKNRRWVDMNDFLAIYILMFYLSSLVRYRPDTLRHLSQTKDRWILESFVVSTPVIFLRHCVNILLGEQIVLERVE